MSFRRTAGWFGIGFVLLEVTGYVLWGAPPATEASAGEIGRFFAQVLRGGAELDAAAMRAVSDISNMVYGLAVLLMTVWAGATAVAVYRRRVMPRWFGSPSAVAGASGVSGVVSVASARLGWVIAIGFALLVVWVFVASVTMLRDRQSCPEETPRQASAREGGAA